MTDKAWSVYTGPHWPHAKNNQRSSSHHIHTPFRALAKKGGDFSFEISEETSYCSTFLPKTDHFLRARPPQYMGY